MIVGKHVIADFKLSVNWRQFPLANTIITNEKDCVSYLQQCLKQNNATVLNHQSQGFSELTDSKQEAGVTALFLLAESHVSIHTWPEHDGFCMDFFTCGDAVCPVALFETIKKDLGDYLLNAQVIILDRHLTRGN